jgi:acyl carrier protein
MNDLLEILSGLHPETDFGTCKTLIDDGVLDSFDIITIVADINDVFDIAIPAEEIIPQNFNSAAALYELITRLGDE